MRKIRKTETRGSKGEIVRTVIQFEPIPWLRWIICAMAFVGWVSYWLGYYARHY